MYQQLTYLLVQRVEKHNCLDGLAKSHLIGEYCVDAVRPGVPQPVDSFQLVAVQRSTALRDVLRLIQELLRQLRSQSHSVNHLHRSNILSCRFIGLSSCSDSMPGQVQQQNTSA